MERDKQTLAELADARRIFEEIGLTSEARETDAVEKVLERGGAREFATLYEISQVINATLGDFDALLEQTTDLAVGSLEADRGLIILIDEQTGEHRVVTARNVEQEVEQDAIQYSQTAVEAAASGRSLLSADAGEDFGEFRSVSLYQIKSFMCVPMRLRDRIIGTVYIDSRRIGNLFHRDDLRFLEAFAAQAALAIENARLMRQLREENRQLRQTVSRQFGFDTIVGKSPAIRRVLQVLSRAAGGSAPILLTGGSGTGKELFAKSIHVASDRADGPFVALNCAAIPAELLESELFGHARGAFSGADRDKKGLLESAGGGTFFFDEIGEMTPSLQAKLLRAVEEGAIRRVGENRMRPVDVRLISATNRNLRDEISAGRFREDLYYRLNVVAVRIPPLVDRRDDIVPLAEHFLARANAKTDRRFDGFTRAAIDVLLGYAWPGNVRELENAVERAVALADGPRIDVADLPDEVISGTGRGTGSPPLGASSDRRAASLWTAIVDQQQSFWEVVREPFLRRELNQEDVKTLVERGLRETGGSYKKLAELFHVGRQYKKFHAFLKNNHCHVPRAQFVSHD